MGLREFFSRFVPGAVLLFLFPPARDLLGIGGNAVELLGFSIAAYLAGSVAAGLGATLDLATDALLRRRAFRRAFAPKLAGRETLAAALRDRLLRTRLGLAVRGDSAPSERDEDGESESRWRRGKRSAEEVKAFWWDHLRLNCPAAIAELDRIEAAQKLFRSLIAVFVFLGMYGWQVEPIRLGPAPLELPAAALFALAAISVPFYVGGRLTFLSVVYRLAAAYSVTAAEPRGRSAS